MITTNYKEIFNLDKVVLDEIDPEIHKLLSFWESGKDKITVHTSGSKKNKYLQKSNDRKCKKYIALF